MVDSPGPPRQKTFELIARKIVHYRMTILEVLYIVGKGSDCPRCIAARNLLLTLEDGTSIGRAHDERLRQRGLRG